MSQLGAWKYGLPKKFTMSVKSMIQLMVV